MDEARKTNALRGAAFAAQYLDGRVIDIGAGRDLVSANAERFDIDDGDANFISRFRPAGAYDAVHSSHCLEHMHDPPAALAEWWSLLKPGGYLILVVPDEDLYEQGIWPSIFNRDHKATFRLGQARFMVRGVA
ncbi:MAG: class I SAM-dependent methyltransferase [Betaproteobacteria bacterium]|nr:class I SAM-dependent methyltransferase [Betaproteobacteria bacterium]